MRSAWVVAILTVASLAYGETVDELKKMLEDKEYQQVVRLADKALIQQDPLLDQAVIYDLMILKAEALLRQGQRASAGREFASAARGAPDLEKAAWARASRLAIARSVDNAYTPRTGDKEPIDIIDPDSRQKAFLAMAEDDRQAAERSFRGAVNARTLPALEDAAEQIGDVWVLELASTGKAEDTSKMLLQIGEHARLLITQDMAQIARRLAHIDRLAGEYDGFGGRRGITSRERGDLRELGGYLAQVSDRVLVYRELAQRTGGPVAEWDRLFGQIMAMQSDLDLLLGTRY